MDAPRQDRSRCRCEDFRLEWRVGLRRIPWVNKICGRICSNRNCSIPLCIRRRSARVIVIVIGNTHVARSEKLARGATDYHCDKSLFEFSPRASWRQSAGEPQPPVEHTDQGAGGRPHHFAALLDALSGQKAFIALVSAADARSISAATVSTSRARKIS
jgi:hypothetical protein